MSAGRLLLENNPNLIRLRIEPTRTGAERLLVETNKALTIAHGKKSGTTNSVWGNILGPP